MKVGKWRIISESEYQALQASEENMQVLMNVHRWFSGWRDLDIIWDYILGKTRSRIDTVRVDYAKARGTDEYGKPDDAAVRELLTKRGET